MANTGNRRSGGGSRSGTGPRRIEAGKTDAAVPKDAEAATLGRPRAPTEAEAADRGASVDPVSTDDLAEAQKFALEQLYGKRKAQSIFKRLTDPDVAVRDDAESLLARATEWDAFTKSAAYSGMDKAARKEARTAHATMPAEELAAKYGVADSGDNSTTLSEDVGKTADMFDAAEATKRSQLINTIAGLDSDVRRKLDSLVSDEDGGDSVKHEPLLSDFDAIGESPENPTLDDLEGELAALQQFAGKVNAAYDAQFPRAGATATPQPQAPAPQQPAPAAATAPATQPTAVDMVERAKYQKAVAALKKYKAQAEAEAAANAAAQAALARLNAAATSSPPNAANAGGTTAATGAQTPTPATPTMVQRTKSVMSSLVPSWAGPVYRGAASLSKTPIAATAKDKAAMGMRGFRDIGTAALATDAVVGTPISLLAGSDAFPITRAVGRGIYGALGGYGDEEETGDDGGIDWFMYENQPAAQPQPAPMMKRPTFPMATPAAMAPPQGGFSPVDAINEYNQALMPQPPLRYDAPVRGGGSVIR